MVNEKKGKGEITLSQMNIEKLDEIPLNLNGKIDRAFLNQKVNEGK